MMNHLVSLNIGPQSVRSQPLLASGSSSKKGVGICGFLKPVYTLLSLAFLFKNIFVYLFDTGFHSVA